MPYVDAGRVHGVELAQRPSQAGRQCLEREVLVGPDGVAAVVGDLVGVQQRERRRHGKVREVGVPGVGEVQFVVRLLDDADHVRSIVEGLDERSDVASAELIGEALEVVERHRLVGQEHDEVVEHRGTQRGERRRRRARMVRSSPVTNAPSDPAAGSTSRVTCEALPTIDIVARRRRRRCRGLTTEPRRPSSPRPRRSSVGSGTRGSADGASRAGCA